MFDQQHLFQLIWGLIWVVIGVGFFAAAFYGMTKVSPFSIKKEIEEDQNIALGIIIGSVILGLAIIIAAVVH